MLGAPTPGLARMVLAELRYICNDPNVTSLVPSPDDWRFGVDLDAAEVALSYLSPLLEAVYRAGSHMMIRVDAERTNDANPARFTVVISGNLLEDRAIRYDDADLG